MYTSVMAQLDSCANCRGFVPEGQATCPNCDLAQPPRRSKFAAGLIVAGAGLAMVALSACYGPPPICQGPDGGSVHCSDLCQNAGDAGNSAGCIQQPNDSGSP